jgi:hypothetical protein
MELWEKGLSDLVVTKGTKWHLTQVSVILRLGLDQSDQIGRIFAQCVIVSFGQ